MKLLRVAAVMTLMIGPAYAQTQTPSINLLADGPSKTPDEIEADQAKEKAYQDTLRKIPDVKVSNDPWGGVRSSDASKTSADKTPGAKTPASKTAAAAKAKVKTGNNAN